jgi:hypothetical protein
MLTCINSAELTGKTQHAWEYAAYLAVEVPACGEALTTSHYERNTVNESLQEAIRITAWGISNSTM